MADAGCWRCFLEGNGSSTRIIAKAALYIKNSTRTRVRSAAVKLPGKRGDLLREWSLGIDSMASKGTANQVS